MPRCFDSEQNYEKWNNIITHLKNSILAQDRGGAGFQTGGILLYVEDLKRRTNKEVGPKGILGMGSKQAGP